MSIDKTKHIEAGLQIKIVLASCFDNIYKHYAKNIIPGSIHTIVDRPTRRSRKNGDMGVWIEGEDDQKVFVRFFGWKPYIPPTPMVRTKFVTTRTKFNTMRRTK